MRCESFTIHEHEHALIYTERLGISFCHHHHLCLVPFPLPTVYQVSFPTDKRAGAECLPIQYSVEEKNTWKFSFTHILFIHGIMLWHRDTITFFHHHDCDQVVLLLPKINSEENMVRLIFLLIIVFWMQCFVL
jgi:hypothetical protein